MRVRDSFECSKCRAHLVGRTFWAMVVVLILWSLVDLGVMVVSWGLFDDWRAMVMQLVLSGAAGCALFVLGMRAWAVVALAEGSNAS